ncbi:hypothetical protein WT28_15070 [Burkholderia stagnalis]|nr:hypothetical protein WT28_15070 [Burkholderia stagnalis]
MRTVDRARALGSVFGDQPHSILSQLAHGLVFQKRHLLPREIVVDDQQPVVLISSNLGLGQFHKISPWEASLDDGFITAGVMQPGMIAPDRPAVFKTRFHEDNMRPLRKRLLNQTRNTMKATILPGQPVRNFT